MIWVYQITTELGYLNKELNWVGKIKGLKFQKNRENGVFEKNMKRKEKRITLALRYVD